MRQAVTRALPQIQQAMPKGTQLDLMWLKAGRDGRSRLTIYLRAPSNFRLEATEKCVAEVEKFLETNIPAEDRGFIISKVGVTPDWSALYVAPNAGPFDATICVQLADEAKMTAQGYAVKLRHEFQDDPRFADLQASFQPGNERPILIRTEGGKGDQALKLAKEARARAATVPGRPMCMSCSGRMPYLVIEVDRQKAARVGLSPREVILQVVAAFNSSVAIGRNFWVDAKSGNQYLLAVPQPEWPGKKLDDLLNIEATGTKADQPVKLSSLATVEHTDRRRDRPRQSGPRRRCPGDCGGSQPQSRGPRHRSGVERA